MVTNTIGIASALNHYSIRSGADRKIVIPQASRLAKIQEITVRGILLRNQSVTFDLRMLKRRVFIGKRGGHYVPREDGSLEFCLGVRSLQPHILCRLNDAAAWSFRLNQAIGHRISVASFLRCSFDHPGFDVHENARIFEIHPVRTVEIGGELHSFELNVHNSVVQDWTSELNEMDESRQVRYWKGSDTLEFSRIEVEKKEYVRVTGHISDIKLNISTGRPAWFILASADVSRQVKVTCLQGTRAARQLRDLTSTQVTVVGLRCIDLARALEDRYRINLFAIDVQPAEARPNHSNRPHFRTT